MPQMKKTLLVAILSAVLTLSCTERDHYVRITGYAQGGTYAVTLNTRGAKVPAEEMRDSVEAILTLVDTTLSGYNKGSMLSRFNAGETIRPNSLFLDMYAEAYRWWTVSGGALDFAAGPLYDAWGFGFREGEMPSGEKIAEILRSSGMKLLRPSVPVREDGTLRWEDLLADGVEADSIVLNYNAIAQGYTADLVAAYLYRAGVKDMLVDIGEIWCDGLNPSRLPWAVGVDRPEDGNESPGEKIQNVWRSGGLPSGVVTSGDYRKFYVRDGRKYSHTIDPRSGHPAGSGLLSATVVSSRSSAAADALATWCMVEGPEKAKEIISEDPSAEGYLVFDGPDGTMAEWASEGFTSRK